MALGRIVEIRVAPRADGLRVTVRRHTSEGLLTASETSSEIKDALASIEMKHEKKAQAIAEARAALGEYLRAVG